MRTSSKPVVKGDVLFLDKSGTNAIRVGAASWQTWLAANDSFVFEGGAGHFTARCELRRGGRYWYAYRRRGGKLAKAYLGRGDELTLERMEHAGARLASSREPTGPAVTLEKTPAEIMPPPEPDESNSSFLSLSKVKPPSLPRNLVARPRLTQRLAAPLNLVVAPSGFGKSTLLNEWQQTCGLPVAWISLDRDDDHPLRFWSTVATALRTANPKLGRDLAAPHSTSTTSISEMVPYLVNDIIRFAGDSPSTPSVGLVLDDYHCIQNPEIHSALQTLLDHFPPGLSLVIASHVKPPLPLGHLRARQMVTEIGADDLRFTLDEGINFLWHNRQGQPLAYSDMHALVKHTEGWPAGLALATLALSQQGDPRQFIASFSGAHGYLRDYFTESVLHPQPPEAQAFLLKTSILRHLTGSLCDALTGQTDGTAMLSRLWEENVFLTRLGEQAWYRYHDLFAEMLSHQLQAQSPEMIPELHRQAAEWYRANNMPADAVYHLLLIEAWEEATAIVEDVALRELEEFGEDSRLMRWLQQLPETVVQQHKTLLAVYLRLAWVGTPHSEVERFLGRIEANIARTAPGEQTTEQVEVAEEIQRLKRQWAIGAPELPQLPTGAGHDDVWQMLNSIVRYQGYYRRPDLDRAESMAREVFDAARARRNLFITLIAGGAYATVAVGRGHLRHGEKISHQILRIALAQRGHLPEPASITLAALSRIYFEQNQLAQAQQMLTRAAEVDPNPTSSNMPIAIAIQRALLQSVQGNGDAAQATMKAARDLHEKRPSGLWCDQDLIAYQALFCLRNDSLTEAERILDEGESDDQHPFTAVVRGELALSRKQSAQARTLFEWVLTRYPHGLRYHPLLSARVLLAMTFFEQHQLNQARQAMAEAVRLAAPESFLRPFLDYGEKTAPLLALVLYTEKMSPESQLFAKETLRILGVAPGAPKALPKSELAAMSTAASISRREQDILRMVSAGLSNLEIAARCSISDSTVKTHLKNIYHKLGVSNRAQAISKAQALNLV